MLIPIDLVSIDPGNAKSAGQVCYAASFWKGELVECMPLTPETARKQFYCCDQVETVVVEKPQMDRRSRKVPPSILIGLAWNGARTAEAIGAHTFVEKTPTQWKQGRSKHAHHLQIWRRLSFDEQRAVGKAHTWLRKRGARALTPNQVYTVLHAAAERLVRTGEQTKHPFYDVLDAVGIGLEHLGRMDPYGQD